MSGLGNKVNMLKICIINEIANMGFHLAKGFAGAGHQVLVILDADKQEKKELLFSQESIPGVLIHWVRKPKSRFSVIFLAQDLIRAIRRFRPDIIHVNYLWTHFFISALAAKWIRAAIVGVAHGWDILVVPRHPWRRWFQRRMLWLADRIILTAKYFTDILDTVPSRKQVYFPRTIDTDRFHPGIETHDLQKQYGEKIVTAIARLYDTKAYDKLLQAFKIVIDKVPNAQLLVIGDGPEKSNLLRLQTKLELERSVHFLGKVPNVKIASYLNAAKVEAHGFAMPALGISHLEAMACATPVVTYTGDARYEGVLSAFTIEEIAQSIIKVLQDDRFARELGQKAYQYVNKNYSLEAGVQKTLTLYKEIFKERGQLRSR